jgi:hypothetical protein
VRWLTPFMRIAWYRLRWLTPFMHIAWYRSVFHKYPWMFYFILHEHVKKTTVFQHLVFWLWHNHYVWIPDTWWSWRICASLHNYLVLFQLSDSIIDFLSYWFL